MTNCSNITTVYILPVISNKNKEKM